MPHSRLYGSAVDLEFFNWPEFFLTKVAGFCSGLATVGAGGGLAGVRGHGAAFRALLVRVDVHFKPAQDRRKPCDHPPRAEKCPDGPRVFVPSSPR